VPSVCRRIVVLLAVALLGVGAGVGGFQVSTAVAQSGGAGDQQYSDPFGNDDSSSGSGGSGSKSGSGNGSSDNGAAPLTQAPQTSGAGSSGSGSSGSAGAAQSGTSTSPTAPAASGTLPNTGLDARVLVLAGVALVLVGVGLRLRNAPERF
jgi:LPXTG-motif cell wall-anchored protein